jgi:hypothetical protein
MAQKVKIRHPIRQFCQMFLCTTCQNGEKYTKQTQNIPNGRKKDQRAIKYVYQQFPFQDPPKFTQNWDLGLKINHLATLQSGHPGCRLRRWAEMRGGRVGEVNVLATLYLETGQAERK